jgi:hypothetical protein
MIEFILGGLTVALVLMFIGWVDVAFLKRPIQKLRDTRPIYTYMIVSAWECCFFIAGVLCGVYVL